MARAAGLRREIADDMTAYDKDDDDYVTSGIDDVLPATNMSIPVPKKFGKMWEKKITDAQKVDEMEHAIWDKVFELYRQCGDEGAKFGDDDDAVYRYRLGSSVDENIIRVNVKTLMRSTYMRNPHIEFTSMDPDADKLPDCLEYVLQFLMNKQAYPGLNMKPKARRWILHGQLTNFGILRLDYQPHEGSAEEATDQLQELEERLQKAKKVDEIEQLYAELEILHEKLPLSEQKGMHVYNVMPQCLVVPKHCTQIDLSDAKWIAEWFDMDIDYMHNKYYYKKDDDSDEWCLRDKPSIHSKEVPTSPEMDIKQKVINTITGQDTEERVALKQENTVRCYYVYDKMLRRIYLFNSEDWSYPLSVTDDDMQLSRFFRHFILGFGEPIEGITQPGEVSFYVGHVNEVNRINRKAKMIRDSIFGAILYNSKNVDKNEVEKLIKHLKNPKEVEAFGISNNDEQKKISDMIEVLAPPAYQHKEVFDTSQLRQVIDRQAATSEVDRGGEFKTNTTNEAIAQYASNRESMTTTVVDSIEESFEGLGWSMTELLVSKYTKEEIVELVGAKQAEHFEQLSVKEFNQRYRMVIAAGSIEKPTSEFKKKEAFQIAQGLGQIGQGAPTTTLRLIIRMFQAAFSSFLVTKADWDMLAAEGAANMQKGVSTSGEQGPPRPAE